MRARSPAGFDPDVFVGAAGALTGALVVVCIKRLATTEPTPVIMFYYAFWTATLSLIPTRVALGHAELVRACRCWWRSAFSASSANG